MKLHTVLTISLILCTSIHSFGQSRRAIRQEILTKIEKALNDSQEIHKVSLTPYAQKIFKGSKYRRTVIAVSSAQYYLLLSSRLDSLSQKIKEADRHEKQTLKVILNENPEASDAKIEAPVQPSHSVRELHKYVHTVMTSIIESRQVYLTEQQALFNNLETQLRKFLTEVKNDMNHHQLEQQLFQLAQAKSEAYQKAWEAYYKAL